MADMTDVANALVTLCTGIIYPSGTSSPSITGAPVKIYQGWPNADQLARDLAAGTFHVSIFPTRTSKVTDVTMGDMEWEDEASNGTQGTSDRELRREVRQFQISVWANCFDGRDPLAKALDAGLGAITRLALADGTIAFPSYAGSVQNDEAQKAGIYRRDLMYSVNYATLQSVTTYNVNHTTTNVTTGVMGADGLTVSITT